MRNLIFGLIWISVVGYAYYALLNMALSGALICVLVLFFLTPFLGVGIQATLVPLGVLVLRAAGVKTIDLEGYDVQAQTVPSIIPPISFWGGLCQIAIGGTLIALNFAPTCMRWIDMGTWIAVPCEIVSAAPQETTFLGEAAYVLNAKYRYTHDGRDYESDTYAPHNRPHRMLDSVERKAEKLPAGMKTTCIVNPQNPAQAYLIRDIRGMAFLALATGAMVLIAGVIAFGIGSRAWVKNNRPFSDRYLRKERVLFWGLMLAAWAGFSGLFLIGDMCDKAAEGEIIQPGVPLIVFLSIIAVFFLAKLVLHLFATDDSLPALSADTLASSGKSDEDRSPEEIYAERYRRRVEDKQHTYRYKVKDSKRRQMEGTAQADNEEELAENLRGLGYKIDRITEVPTPKSTYYYVGQGAKGNIEEGEIEAESLIEAFKALESKGLSQLRVSDRANLDVPYDDTLADKFSKGLAGVMLIVMLIASGIFTFVLLSELKSYYLHPVRSALTEGQVVSVKSSSKMVQYSFEAVGKPQEGYTRMRDTAADLREGDALTIRYSRNHPWINKAYAKAPGTNEAARSSPAPPRAEGGSNVFLILVSGLAIAAASLVMFLCSSFHYIARIWRARASGDPVPSGDVKRMATNAVSAFLFPLLFISLFAIFVTQDEDALLYPFRFYLILSVFTAAGLSILLYVKSPIFYD